MTPVSNIPKNVYDWGEALFALSYFDLHRFAMFALYMLIATEEYKIMTKKELFDFVIEIDHKVGDGQNEAFLNTLKHINKVMKKR